MPHPHGGASLAREVNMAGDPPSETPGREQPDPVLFPAAPGTEADRLAERMRGMGLECPLDKSAVGGSLVLEPPLRMIDGVKSRRQTWIGAFSYSWSPITLAVRFIGRYCSFAADITFAELQHPRDWLSTSSFIYDDGWMWRDFASAQGRQFRTGDYPDALRHPPITIGNDVWIGSGAYIGSGVHLGSGCIVGAKAVVTRDVPPYAIVVGSPARVVRFRFDEATVEALLALQWWRHAFTEFDGLPVDRVAAMIDGIQARRAAGTIAPYAPACLQLVADGAEPLLASLVFDVRPG